MDRRRTARRTALLQLGIFSLPPLIALAVLAVLLGPDMALLFPLFVLFMILRVALIVCLAAVYFLPY